MSLGLTRTKRRIESISSTAKITKAMEMVATVKLKRFKDAKTNDALYSDEFTRLMGELFSHDRETGSHYGRSNAESLPTLYVVIGSNLGLCGAYNSNLFKYVASHAALDDVILPVGEKALHHFTLDPNFTHVIADSKLSLSLDMAGLHEFAAKCKEDFNAKKYRRICIIYTHYINSISFAPACFQLLPVQLPHEKWEDEDFCPPLFDGTPRELIHRLLPSYLSAIFLDRLNEAQLSEQASRRTAMENANDNADDLIKSLRVEYNKARQNAITQEITEVVSGSAAERG